MPSQDVSYVVRKIRKGFIYNGLFFIVLFKGLRSERILCKAKKEGMFKGLHLVGEKNV